MRPAFLLAPICLAVLACSSYRYPETTLPGKIERIAKESRGLVSVAYEHLGTGARLSFQDTEPLHAASTMKVPVMMALFEAVDRGQLRLDEPVRVANDFASIVDGSRFLLDREADGDAELYAAAGQTRTLEELIRRMIVRSSNLATNLLIEKIGASNVTDLMRRVGAYDIQILRGVEDQKAYDAGLNNRVTAKDLLLLYKVLLDGSTFTPASRDRMLEILKAQEFNDKIPAGLPAGIPVAHKTGDITAMHHDAAIVFPPGEEPYILVVLTAGILDEAQANRAIADVSRAVWEARGDAAPSGAVIALSGAATAPAGAVAALSGAATAPSGAVTAPSGAVTAPSGAVTALSGAVTAPSGAVTAPSGAVTAPSGAVTAPSGGRPCPFGGRHCPFGGRRCPFGGCVSPYRGSSPRISPSGPNSGYAMPRPLQSAASFG